MLKVRISRSYKWAENRYISTTSDFDKFKKKNRIEFWLKFIQNNIFFTYFLPKMYGFDAVWTFK